MEESGYSLEAQLALDDAWIAYVDEFERLRDETIMVDAEERDPHAKPQVPAPAHTPEQLRAWLDIGPDQLSPSALVEQLLHPTPQDWAAVPWEG
jgi:hypothetical protein